MSFREWLTGKLGGYPLESLSQSEIVILAGQWSREKSQALIKEVDGIKAVQSQQVNPYANSKSQANAGVLRGMEQIITVIKDHLS